MMNSAENWLHTWNIYLSIWIPYRNYLIYKNISINFAVSLILSIWELQYRQFARIFWKRARAKWPTFPFSVQMFFFPHCTYTQFVWLFSSKQYGTVFPQLIRFVKSIGFLCINFKWIYCWYPFRTNERLVNNVLPSVWQRFDSMRCSCLHESVVWAFSYFC